MVDDEQLSPEESDEDTGVLLRKLAPLIRNAPVIEKAFRRLCNAGTDLAVAGLQAGTSRFELSKARNEARADEVTENRQMATDSRVMKRLIEDQDRLDRIVFDAIKRLQETRKQEPDHSDAASDEPNQTQIGDDWLEVFRREATDRSQGEMREAFVRILAGEMQAPGTFSIKAVRTLGLLDQETANIFRRAASLRVGMEIVSTPGLSPFILDARIPSLGGNLGENHLQKFNLGYSRLLYLIENGLVYPELKSWRDYKLSMPFPLIGKGMQVPLPMVHQGQRWLLVPTPGSRRKELIKVHGVEFTSVGKELTRIVEIEPDPDFLNQVQEYFLNQHLEMVQFRS